MSQAGERTKAGLNKAARRGNDNKAGAGAGISTSLNWRTGEGYPKHGKRTDLWAWEFLRRNPDYLADWRRFVEVADSLRPEYGKPCTGEPGEWEGQEECPYWLISRGYDEHDPRATVFEPERNKGESESEWFKRVLSAGGRCHMVPLDRALGLRWGLESISDPTEGASDFLRSLGRWTVSPFCVSMPAYYRDNKEYEWVRALSYISEILQADPLPRAALKNARAYLEKVPNAWEKRRAEMREREGFSKPRERVTLEFDMRIPLSEQLKHALPVLLREQKKWKGAGGDCWIGGRKMGKESPGYGTYLRVLDAITEIGETDARRLVREIAAAFATRAKYQVEANYEENHSAFQLVRRWIKCAKELRDGEYRRLVAMAEKPDIRETTKAAKRKK